MAVGTPTSAGGSTTGSTLVTGAGSGAIVILVFAIDNVGATTFTWPSGFTELGKGTITADGQAWGVAWKRLTTTDAGSYAVTPNSTGNNYLVAIPLTGRHATNPPVIGTGTTNNTANATPVTVTAPAVTALAGDDILHVAIPDVTAVGVGNGFSSWALGPEIVDVEGPTGALWVNVGVAKAENVAAGTTGTKTTSFALSGSAAGWWSALIRIPAAAASIGPALQTNVGTVGSSAAATTLVVPVTVDTTPKNLLFLRISASGGRTISSIVDSRGNTWSVDASAASTTVVTAYQCSAPNTTALLNGDIITITFSGTANAAASCSEWSGLDISGTRVSTTSTSLGLDTAPTAPTFTAAAGVVQVAIATNGTITFTPGSGYTAGAIASSTTTVRNVTPEYKILTASGSETPTCTIGATARTWGIAAVSYKVAGGGGPSAYSQAGADSITMSDALTRVVVGARSTGDSVAVTSTVAGATGLPRATADSVAITDSPAAGPIGRIRATADSIAITDSPSRVDALPRALADAVAVTSAVAGLTTSARASSDAVAVASAVGSATGTPRATSDSVAVTSAVGGVSALPRAVADSVAVTSAVAKVSNLPRATADSVAITSALVAVKGYSQAAADAIAITSALAGITTLARSTADSVAITSTVAGNVTLPRAIADAVAVSSAVTGPVGRPRAVADAVAITSALSSVAGTTIFAADSIAVTSALARTLVLSRALADTVAMTDAATRSSMAMSRSLADSVAVTDAIARIVSTPRATADSVAVTSVVSRNIGLARQIADAATISDALTRGALSLPRALADTITVTSSLGGSGSNSQSGTDSISISSSLSRLLTVSRLMADAVAITSAVATAGISRPRSTADNVAMSDSVIRTLTMPRSIADSVAISGAVSSARAMSRSTSDSITITSAVSKSFTIVRGTSDSIAISSSVKAVSTFSRSIFDTIGVNSTATRPVEQIKMYVKSSRTEQVFANGGGSTPFVGSSNQTGAIRAMSGSFSGVGKQTQSDATSTIGTQT